MKPNSVKIRFLSCQIFVLPSTGFELTPLIHCSLMSSALDHSTTSAHIYIYISLIHISFNKNFRNKLVIILPNLKTIRGRRGHDSITTKVS